MFDTFSQRKIRWQNSVIARIHSLELQSILFYLSPLTTENLKTMNSERWHKVKEIFNEAVELKADERKQFLDEAIGRDEEMRVELEKLLASDAEARTTFNRFSVIPAEKIKDKIGNYQIIKKIGEGGMGAVYLAERADIHQKVALKIIRHGADSDMILRRFRREQEILAALEHPNIARLLDVGISTDNVPFLAMEYVEGVDLTTFSHEQNLSVNEKLNLFRKVCEAVAYAHSRLVVHRDLKPSNIIVNQKGEPKLLDFGISKLISETETEEKGTVTSFGMLTPNYASPEQFRGETVSTATDVYSLGVILYELLTDRLPYDVNSRRLDEVAKIVCETNPPKPSEAFSRQPSVVSIEQSADDKLTDENKVITNENQSKTHPKSKIQNPKLLRGDLDNIILKALRKEPERRYSSVEKLSDDLRRHLDGLPVTARPDTFSYRAEKFVTRNRAAVFAGLIIFLTLIGGIAATSWQAVRAERQRALAEKRFGEVRQLANNVVFKYHDEIANLQGATKVRETLITDGLQYLDSLAQEAGDDATLSSELGAAYLRIGNIQGGAYQGNTGDTAAAIGSYGKALTLFENLAKNNSADDKTKAQLSETHKKLGFALRKAGDKTANEHFKTAVALNEELLAAHPNDNAQKIQSAQAYVNLCRVLPKSLAAGESVETCRRALPLLQEVYAQTPDDKALLSEMQTTDNTLGIQFGMMADAVDKETEAAKSKELYRNAADYFRDAANIVEKLVAIEPTNAIYQRSLFATRLNESTARLNSGESEAALQIQMQILANAEKEAAADSDNVQARQDVASTLTQIGLTHTERKDFSTAYVNFKKASALLEQLIEKDAANNEIQQDCFTNYIYAGEAQNGQKDYESAKKTYRTAFDFARRAPKLKDAPFINFAEGLMHEKTAHCLMTEAENGASGAERQRKYLLAREEFQKALAMWKDEESAPDKFGLSEDLLATAQEKSAECEQKAAL